MEAPSGWSVLTVSPPNRTFLDPGLPGPVHGVGCPNAAANFIRYIAFVMATYMSI